ncbi:ATP10 family protein [Clavispora lusitaniae]|uniref:Mitochondrial ATPase complex subunit ATP10 n=2 Tax=Clavispora lusitaniae TaxID=36911 RepID=C4Y2R3_CLAL4|nr:uncharacterized protein CLUG_02826 [Clavispora lusitaniae ATCC 42720]EEQ38700.1 hypothetical protein CLUG_02826 [Clavispora lusitaniae ATCC 42720]KAF5211102.1 Mitochondrial ATPase complex subunit atp10 [Clavispora lusitaniae]KAF7579915.1 ATP10 family protein [Clavispora lusitaniae]OVF04711.1 putative mitochondrial ATPase complex subunit [Clavispora lusitaniae]
MQQRLFSTGARVFERQVPRFVTTLKEASKPALEKSQPITKPFGFDSPTYLSHESSSITNVLSSAAREKRQKQLDHDIVHSPFYESKSFTNTQGKIFTPPVSYFKKDKAKYFPSFTGYTLLNHKKSLYDVLKGKVSIVRIFSTVSGQNCTDTYTPDNLSAEGYEQLQKQYPHTQIVDVNLPQSWIKGLFVKLAKSNLRGMIPPARHDTYFMLSSNTFSVDVKKTLMCDNTCSGYIYILDEDGKIRWATSGFANDDETKVLWRTVRGLEKELEQKTKA